MLCIPTLAMPAPCTTILSTGQRQTQAVSFSETLTAADALETGTLCIFGDDVILIFNVAILQKYFCGKITVALGAIVASQCPATIVIFKPAW
jgi:hypothetical protein